MLLSPADYVAKAKANIKECSVRDVQENQSEDTLLIDVREPAEFSRGHLPGAIHIPRGLLEFEIGKLLASIGDNAGAQKIVVYCGTGGRWMSQPSPNWFAISACCWSSH